MIVARTEIQQMLREWDQRLDTTAAGRPARLLDTLTPHSSSAAPLNRPRLNQRRK